MVEHKEVAQSIDTNGDIVALNVIGLSSIAISLRGTWTGTVQFEATVNGKDWFALSVTAFLTGAAESSATAVGQWVGVVSGFQQVRVRASAAITGQLDVIVRAVAGGGKVAATATVDTTGLATDAKLDDIITALANPATETTLAAIQTLLATTGAAIRGVKQTGQWQDQSGASGEDASGAAGVVVKAADAAKKNLITFAKITATAAATVWIEDEDGAIVLSKTPLGANNTIIFNLGLNPSEQPTANKALEIHSSTADVIHWDVFGYTPA